MPLSLVLPALPAPLAEEVTHLLSSPLFKGHPPAEVRMRAGRVSSLSLFRRGKLVNLPLSYVADGDALKETFARAVGGSLYAYEEGLKEGYIPLKNGIRVGVAGQAFCKGGAVLSLSAIDSLVFRLPSAKGSADALFAFYRESRGGILLFSPPGGGKTTLLRALAARVAEKARVAVIDTRGELFFEEKELLIDRLAGYPKVIGAEIAVRTLSPELLILDELGASEAKALSALVSFGIRTVASVHGDSADALLLNHALAPLFQTGMFSHLWDVRCSAPSEVKV